MIDGMDLPPMSFTAPKSTLKSSMRRRANIDNKNEQKYRDNYNNGSSSSSTDYYSSKTKVPMSRKVLVRNLDLFPKVEQDLTIKTEQGGMISLLSVVVIFFLVLNDVMNHLSMNSDTSESLVVDTSLSQKMQVNINITFPSLACVDLHVDVMDVAGDSQINIEETLIKKRLWMDGRPMSGESIKAETNQNHKDDQQKQKAMLEKLGPDYCGSCFGAGGECCNTCDDVIDAYKKKSWNSQPIMNIADQCVREGRSNGKGPKRVTKGQGCNLNGSMYINRVAGNFHIALGEGVERDGRHIHLFLPDDTANFNASHVVHELTFGPKVNMLEHGGLEGVNKITDNHNGGTGLFQYFIKVVPTVFKDRNGKILGETNRYFFTERYRPLMTEDLLDDEHFELAEGEDDDQIAGTPAGGHHHKDSHSKQDHHHHMNSILPGVFFVYEIYPFAVEVTQKSVPLSHLLIRVSALVGGVITIVGWIDGYFFARSKNRN